MKKFLLIAAAVLVASTASAQLLKKQSSTVKQTLVRSELKHVQKQQVPVTMMHAPVQSIAEAPMQSLLGKTVKLSARELKSIKAARKAAELQTQYDCYGIDDKGENVTWTMASAENEDGDMFLLNVIPTPYPEELPVIGAEINQSGSVINIGVQEVFSYESEAGTTVHVFLTGEVEEDHSINLTINDDGTLSTVKGEEINYLAFDSDQFDVSNIYLRVEDGGHYLGYLEYVSHIQYVLPGMSPTPNPNYAPEGVNLNITMSPEGMWYGHQFSIMPANVPARFTNFTTDMTDAFDWSVTDEDDEVITGNERDFSFVPTCFMQYSIPAMVAKYKDAASNPFQWNEDGYVLGSGGASIYLKDPADIMVNNCNLDYELTRYSFIATPDINSQNYSISSLILYQGKPEAPLYFEGINLFVDQFSQKEDFELTCKIMKCKRNDNGVLELGDLIAVADVDPESMTVLDSGRALMTWTQFEEEDENGFTTPVGYVQVDDEFAIVFEGWDNGTFSARPYGEYANTTAQLTSTYLTLTGSDDVNGFQSMKNRLYVGFIEGIYGSLYTADDTTLEMPVEGGSATLHIEPMYSTSDEEGNSVTALWFAEDYELPEWINLSVSNEVYTSDEYSFDLTVEAAALPNGLAGRTETIDLYQYGAKLTLVVNQGKVDGITVTTATVRTADGKVYSLDGRRQLKTVNGIVIRDGRKFIRK